MLSRRLSLRADASEITRMNAWLDRSFIDSGLDGSVADDLKLCVNEAVCNTMLYAFNDEPDPMISVEVEIAGGVASATLTDNGMAFDPLALPAPATPTDLETAQIGGFGVQLIRESSNSVDYQRVGDRNRLHIVCGDTD
jgi:anti-sigma regulatory factor (Ser/Thr protein kinase)